MPISECSNGHCNMINGTSYSMCSDGSTVISNHQYDCKRVHFEPINSGCGIFHANNSANDLASDIQIVSACIHEDPSLLCSSDHHNHHHTDQSIHRQPQHILSSQQQQQTYQSSPENHYQIKLNHCSRVDIKDHHHRNGNSNNDCSTASKDVIICNGNVVDDHDDQSEQVDDTGIDDAGINGDETNLSPCLTTNQHIIINPMSECIPNVLPNGGIICDHPDCDLNHYTSPLPPPQPPPPPLAQLSHQQNSTLYHNQTHTRPQLTAHSCDCKPDLSVTIGNNGHISTSLASPGRQCSGTNPHRTVTLACDLCGTLSSPKSNHEPLACCDQRSSSTATFSCSPQNKVIISSKNCPDNSIINSINASSTSSYYSPGGPSLDGKLLKDDDDQVAYLPFIILVVILTIVTGCLIFASVLYIKFSSSYTLSKNPCDIVKCDNGSVCIVSSSNNQATCQCPNCSHNYDPICASDGSFYTNECVMRRESCEEGRSLTKVHAENCGGCSNVLCQFYSNCDIVLGHAKCLCPEECLPNDDPVCGTDGNTYANDCELRLASCRSKQYISIASKGICDLCINVHCQYGSHCEDGVCVCPKECPTINRPVCSTHGVTYVNECYLRLDGCRQRMDIAISFFGECQEREDLQMKMSYVSGYMENCDQTSCRFGGVCDYDAEGVAHCVCPHRCPASESEADYVCGSDGHLYENECILQREACRKQRDILVVAREKCPQSGSSSPCNGEPPLIDPITGREYFCGDGPRSKHCPPNSHCHREPLFAKCCREPDHDEDCRQTAFGCCPDGMTTALGKEGAGCPSKCNCNKLGSYSAICDPITSQCFCRSNVGGLHCDRCKPGYWGLHMISERINGCTPCSCNRSGSVRDDCEQMTGRCLCKQGIKGTKCDECPQEMILGPEGCFHENLTKYYLDTSCDDLVCLYGSVCRKFNSLGSKCVCEFNCEQNLASNGQESGPLCASDKSTYTSECDMKYHACKMQRVLTILHQGPCSPHNQSTIADFNPSMGWMIKYTTSPMVASSSALSPSLSSSSSTSNQYRTTDLTDQTRSTRDVSIINSDLDTQSYTTTTKPTFNIVPDTFSIPAFSGESSLELSCLCRAHRRLEIEMVFTVYSNSAIILYNGQTSTGEGDFVSISVNQGYIEFRYDLGSGVKTLRSRESIVLGKNITLKANRHWKKGTLIVDDQLPVHGESNGLMKSLDLSENLFLGMIWSNSSKIYRNIGTEEGFIGCIHQLRIDDREIDFGNKDDGGSNSIFKATRVHECEPTFCLWLESHAKTVKKLDSSFDTSVARVARHEGNFWPI
ncbi:uncharacterized protein LOC141854438 isoform X2 [Brevipalpus obovatus]|uniref:uncharacterized protein LOC141854438 isoform X2 n=1 Tax=Brevipalpus obovatus TaxID=246614 RepID=UPI003D9E7862